MMPGPKDVRGLKVTGIDTHLVGANWRNLVIVQVFTDDGSCGLGEATTLWQPEAAEAAVRELGRRHVIGRSPFDIEELTLRMVRDEFMRGDGILLSAMAGIEIALWDIMGQVLDCPVYDLIGGRTRRAVKAYANGWYGDEGWSPDDLAVAAAKVSAMGYGALKLDPFGSAGREMDADELAKAEEIVAAVRKEVGSRVKIMIECHGRFGVGQALEVDRRLRRYNPFFIEEPTDPEPMDVLARVASRMSTRLATGERCWGRFNTASLLRAGFVDILQSDPVQCGGILETKKIAGMADSFMVPLMLHNPYGPVAEMAAIHIAASTPNVEMIESFSEFDVHWRKDLVDGGPVIEEGEYRLPTRPGLGLTLNPDVVAAHPYVDGAFLRMWSEDWAQGFS